MYYGSNCSVRCYSILGTSGLGKKRWRILGMFVPRLARNQSPSRWLINQKTDQEYGQILKCSGEGSVTEIVRSRRGWTIRNIHIEHGQEQELFLLVVPLPVQGLICSHVIRILTWSCSLVRIDLLKLFHCVVK